LVQVTANTKGILHLSVFLLETVNKFIKRFIHISIPCGYSYRIS